MPRLDSAYRAAYLTGNSIGRDWRGRVGERGGLLPAICLFTTSPPIFVLVLALLAGCTPMRWERPDTDAATAEADSVECRAIARAQHRRLTERPFLIPYFIHVRDNKGRPRSIPVVPWQQFGPPVWYPYAPWLANDQLMLKHELYERCLEGKGYRLVPDVSADDTPASSAPASDPADAAGAG